MGLFNKDEKPVQPSVGSADHAHGELLTWLQKMAAEIKSLEARTNARLSLIEARLLGGAEPTKAQLAKSWKKE